MDGMVWKLRYYCMEGKEKERQGKVGNDIIFKSLGGFDPGSQHTQHT